MSNHKLVALLPMKANSERVKGKNFKLFAGKPLYQWILDSLLAVKDVEQVIINTDAREILLDSGLKETDRIVVRDRRPELCGDFVSMNLILEDDIKNIDSESYLMTHTTNPLISSTTIQEAVSLYRNSERDSLFSVNKMRTRFYRSDTSPVNHDPNNLIRTQDLEPWFEENSCLYLFSRESFSSTMARIGKTPILFETPKLESIDIDEEEDWMIAEALASKLIERV